MVFRIRKFLGILPVILLFSVHILYGQVHHVSGKVVDKQSGKPLAFVNIVINDGRTGGTTDIDGKFEFRSSAEINALTLTYIGYERIVFPVQHEQNTGILIKLKSREIELDEVVIYPEENPAHRIIKLVVENRDNNDPEKKKSFSYTAYDRTIFTVDLDTLNQIDTLRSFVSEMDSVRTDSVAVDSSLIEIKEFFAMQDIAIMESVTERKFMAPDRNYENVIANRVSGFKDPIFVFLISQFQSTTFYTPLFHILDKHYVNPISKGSSNKYFFLIEDTTYTATNDTVFIISYRPKINTNFDGLKGVLYINSDGWAIQNVIANPAVEEGISIRIQHMYEKVDNDHWFPVQLNTDVIFKNMQATAGEKVLNMVAIGKSYLKDIVVNPELVRRQFDVLGVDVEPDSHDKSEDFWAGYRIDSLTERDKRTYAFLDSIGDAENFDRIAKGFETVISGKIPYKWIDIDLDKFIRYNGFQGFYLGLGAHTNTRLSKRFKTGGYWGYGFRDKRAKYGGDVSYLINRRKEVEIMLDYFYDLEESGGVKFFDDKKGVLTGERWRDFLINRVNYTQSLAGRLSFRMLRDFKVGLGMRWSSKDAAFDYKYGYSEDGIAYFQNEFDFVELKAGFRFAFREEFIVTKRARISLGTKYPIVWFQYTRGFDNLMKGDFAYDRFDMKIEKSFYIKYLGRTKLLLKTGLIIGSPPYCNLYNGNGSYRIVTIFAPNSFATMRMNEFLSDRYAALYFSHNFGKLLLKGERFQPEFVLATNIGFGSLSQKNQDLQHNVNYKLMNHGYYESGILINNMLNLTIYNLGIGVFYRYGPYSLQETFDNFAFKVTLMFPMIGRE